MDFFANSLDLSQPSSSVNGSWMMELSKPQSGQGAIAEENLWLLVFDLDGTLIDSSEDLCASVNAALAHVGRLSLPQQNITGFVGNGAATLIHRALAATGHPELHGRVDPLFQRCFAFFLEFYREHKLDSTRVYPGVLESLRDIRARSPELLMAVLTNKPVRPSREICTALGLAPFFFANYGGNSFATKKPSPEGLLAIMEEAKALWAAKGTPPEDLQSDGVMMIGDSDVDVLAGRACGARTLGCSYGLAPEALLRASPDFMVDSPFAWPTALGLGPTIKKAKLGL